MITINTPTLLDLWRQLTLAELGNSAFSAHGIEVYPLHIGGKYTTSQYKPTSTSSSLAEFYYEDVEEANRSLYEVLAAYQKEYDVCITVDDKPLGDWLTRSRNDHRWVIEVHSE